MSNPPINIHPKHWQIVSAILQKYIPDYEVWAFGSRTQAIIKDYSDLDLTVISDKPLSLALATQLTDAFSESDLPWKVDIVDWATTSVNFRKIIAQSKVVIQQKDSVLLTTRC